MRQSGTRAGGSKTREDELAPLMHCLRSLQLLSHLETMGFPGGYQKSYNITSHTFQHLARVGIRIGEKSSR